MQGISAFTTLIKIGYMVEISHESIECISIFSKQKVLRFYLIILYKPNTNLIKLNNLDVLELLYFNV